MDSAQAKDVRPPIAGLTQLRARRIRYSWSS